MVNHRLLPLSLALLFSVILLMVLCFYDEDKTVRVDFPTARLIIACPSSVVRGWFLVPGGAEVISEKGDGKDDTERRIKAKDK